MSRREIAAMNGLALGGCHLTNPPRWKDFEVNLLAKRSRHTLEKIGGTSISNTAAVVENVLIGGREGSALCI